ncbi:hypothetical protein METBISCDRAFT_21579 [Metschnikowia bicuspidata]|uniref:Uncharacterized protein n=1 Tax=Metschnikowia bicuspidata TaxID=27322 RepID=A0A4P9ZJQ2_9ASCO|nr:hypothetical protein METBISCDRAFT_21579 [Metschnikowia bicuspidata]
MKLELFTVASLAAVAVADNNLAYYNDYYADLSKLAGQFTTGYYSAINSFYARSDVAEAISKIHTMTDPGAYETYRVSFQSKYWTELSSIYSEFNLDLATVDSSMLADLTATASPSALATGSGSSATGSGSSATGFASPRLSSSSASSSSTSSRANFGKQQKPLWALTGLLGALPALLL